MPDMTAIPRFGCASAVRRTFVVNGLRLSALEWPAPGRPPLCFLHGGSAHAHWFDAVVPDLVARYHVLSVDQRGHGESEWSPTQEYATESFASDLLGVMDAMGWTRMTLAGHSMGGHNSIAFSGWYPERVSALAIIDSRPSLPREGITQRDGRFLYRFDPATSGERQPVDAWPLLERITAPTLVVRGEHSPILPVPMAQDILKRVSRARLVEIPGAYHHLVLDAPQAFTQALDAFLAEAVV
jgi:pimeloyl-ACP methyl ester carboxylesterase